MKKQKLLTLLCVAALSACCALPVSAEEVQPTAAENGGWTVPANIAIYNYYSDLSLGSGGKMTCSGSTSVQSGYTAEVYVELQQSDGGWRTIDHWSGSGGLKASAGGDHYGTKGYNYRVKTTHKAYKNGSLVETLYSYSNVVYY